MRNSDLGALEDDAIEGQVTQRLAEHFFRRRRVSHRGDREHSPLGSFQDNAKFPEPLANEALETVLGLDVGGKVCSGPHLVFEGWGILLFEKTHPRSSVSLRSPPCFTLSCLFKATLCFPCFGRPIFSSANLNLNVLIGRDALNLLEEGRFNSKKNQNVI